MSEQPPGSLPSTIAPADHPTRAGMGSSYSNWLVGWLVWAERPFETVFQSISGRLPERGREERNDRREKKCPHNPHPHLLLNWMVALDLTAL